MVSPDGGSFLHVAVVIVFLKIIVGNNSHNFKLRALGSFKIYYNYEQFIKRTSLKTL